MSFRNENLMNKYQLIIIRVRMSPHHKAVRRRSIINISRKRIEEVD